MWRLAMILEFILATVYGPAVFVFRMPDLSAVPATTVFAFDFAGEDGYPNIAFLPFPAPLDFFLHPVKHLRADDSFMVMLHVVLRDFSFYYRTFVA